MKSLCHMGLRSLIEEFPETISHHPEGGPPDFSLSALNGSFPIDWGNPIRPQNIFFNRYLQKGPPQFTEPPPPTCPYGSLTVRCFEKLLPDRRELRKTLCHNRSPFREVCCGSFPK